MQNLKASTLIEHEEMPMLWFLSQAAGLVLIMTQAGIIFHTSKKDETTT